MTIAIRTGTHVRERERERKYNEKTRERKIDVQRHMNREGQGVLAIYVERDIYIVHASFFFFAFLNWSLIVFAFSFFFLTISIVSCYFLYPEDTKP